jgi:hypothetical protein
LSLTTNFIYSPHFELGGQHQHINQTDVTDNLEMLYAVTAPILLQEALAKAWSIIVGSKLCGRGQLFRLHRLSAVKRAVDQTDSTPPRSCSIL